MITKLQCKFTECQYILKLAPYIGYSLQLAASVFLYAHMTVFVIPVIQRVHGSIAQRVYHEGQSDDPFHHECTLPMIQHFTKSSMLLATYVRGLVVIKCFCLWPVNSSESGKHLTLRMYVMA